MSSPKRHMRKRRIVGGGGRYSATDRGLAEARLAIANREPPLTLAQLCERARISMRTAARVKAILRERGETSPSHFAPKSGPTRPAFTEPATFQRLGTLARPGDEPTETGDEPTEFPDDDAAAELRKREAAEKRKLGGILDHPGRVALLSKLASDPELRPEVRVSALRALAVIESSNNTTGPIGRTELTELERIDRLATLNALSGEKIARAAFEKAFPLEGVRETFEPREIRHDDAASQPA